VIHLGDEVAQRESERTREAHRDAVARGHGEVAIGHRQARRVAAPHRRGHFFARGAGQAGGAETNQVNQAFDAVKHSGLPRTRSSHVLGTSI